MTTIQSMEKQHRNQDKLDKTTAVLRHNPQGLTVVELSDKTGFKRTTMYGIITSLELQGKARFDRGTGTVYPEGKYRYAEGSPELESLREQFKREYLDRFDKIERTYFSSPKKAWKQLKKFAATWPEQAMSDFLSLDLFESKDVPEPYWFQEILYTFRVDVWTALLKGKIADMPQTHEN